MQVYQSILLILVLLLFVVFSLALDDQFFGTCRTCHDGRKSFRKKHEKPAAERKFKIQNNMSGRECELLRLFVDSRSFPQKEAEQRRGPEEGPPRTDTHTTPKT